MIENLFWVAVAIGLSVVTVAAQLTEINLLIEMIISFKIELMVSMTVLLLLALIRRRIVSAAVLLILLLFNLTEVVSSFKLNDLSRVHNEHTHQGGTAKLLMTNLRYGNENIPAFLELINREQPDVIFALEIIGPWMEAIEKLSDRYVSYVPQQAMEGLQVRMLSKLPMTDVKILALTDPLRPVLSGRIVLDNQELRVLGVHLSAPQFPERFELRNKQLESLAALVNAEKIPTVLLGDLNITRWSPYFRRFVQQAELVDSRLGRGFLHSWRPFGESFPMFRAPIDQVLSTPDVRVRNVWLGPDIGSDHLPMIAEISQHFKTDQNFYQQLRSTSYAQ